MVSVEVVSLIAGSRVVGRTSFAASGYGVSRVS
jgi:hypothetical protein